MNGARNAAFDFVLPRVQEGESVLDIGAGGSPLAGILAGRKCEVVAIDIDEASLMRAWREAGKTYTAIATDIRQVEKAAACWDVAVAVYALQHMVPFEPAVWVRIRELLRPGGRLLYFGRYRKNSPWFEKERNDPLMSGDEKTLRMLALLTGFKLKDFQLYLYDGPQFTRLFEPQNADIANAFGAELEAVSL